MKIAGDDSEMCETVFARIIVIISRWKSDDSDYKIHDPLCERSNQN